MPPEAQVVLTLMFGAATFALGLHFGRRVDAETARRASRQLHEDAARWPYTTEERFARVHTANELSQLTGGKS